MDCLLLTIWLFYLCSETGILCGDIDVLCNVSGALSGAFRTFLVSEMLLSMSDVACGVGGVGGALLYLVVT